MQVPELPCTCSGPGTFSICYKHGVAKFIPKEELVSTDMFPDPFINFCLENPMTSTETCTECGKPVNVQIMKGTGLCGEICRKKKAGEEDRPSALTDAGITNLLNQPTGEINLNGIK